MKIIDAHIHFTRNHGFDELAIAASHENNAEHLRQAFDASNVRHAIVMGNNSNLDAEILPPFLSYCFGIDSATLNADTLQAHLDTVEMHFKSHPNCVGLKLYPGYNRQYITEHEYLPFYDLAAQYDKPVAIHTGATALPRAHLKYCHPMIIDELAADFPETKFVICHYGNPWVVDAAAVIDKNPNVYADLSGILDGGMHDIDAYIAKNPGYAEHLKTWFAYPAAFDRLMYGTDWPLVNIPQYIDFISRLIPEQHWDDVFYNNANQIYKLGL